MSRRHILIIDGHPDAEPQRYIHALAERTWMGQWTLVMKCTYEPAPAMQECQQMIAWADHVVILYPLWLGSMPALLKAFLEQVMRPGFAFPKEASRGMLIKLLKGKSARVVVTMGMPAFFYRVFYRAHSLKSLERNILSFVGFKPVRASIIGNVESRNPVEVA